MTKLEQKKYIDDFVNNNLACFKRISGANGKELLKIIEEIEDLPTLSFKTRLKITSMIIRAYLLTDN